MSKHRRLYLGRMYLGRDYVPVLFRGAKSIGAAFEGKMLAGQTNHYSGNAGLVASPAVIAGQTDHDSEVAGQ